MYVTFYCTIHLSVAMSVCIMDNTLRKRLRNVLSMVCMATKVSRDQVFVHFSVSLHNFLSWPRTR